MFYVVFVRLEVVMYVVERYLNGFFRIVLVIDVFIYFN